MNLTMQLISHKSEQMLADNGSVLSDGIWQAAAEKQKLCFTEGSKQSAHLFPQKENPGSSYFPRHEIISVMTSSWSLLVQCDF